MTTSPLNGARPPRVSIGMPVYNGEKHVAQSIENMLTQTFGDFELIISDNASTDRTAEICADFAARDPRIRLIRQPQNQGAAFNWNAVVAPARGEYFKWASANDFCAPNMLERCVQTLDREPDVVICYGRTELLDDTDKSLGQYPHDVEVLDPRPSVRFRRLCLEMRLNNAQAGMIRLDVLRRTGIERPYSAGDMVLMAELGLYGGYRRLPEVLLYRRMGRQTASRYLSAAEMREFLAPQQADSFHQLALLAHTDYFRSILRSPIPLVEKCAALGFVARSAWWHRKDLWRELRRR